MPDAAYVPYQAYKPKRHSKTFSNPILTPNVSPPPLSTAASPARFDDDKRFDTMILADSQPPSGNQLRAVVTPPLSNELSSPPSPISLANSEHSSSPQFTGTDSLRLSQGNDVKGKGVTSRPPSLLMAPPSPSADSLIEVPSYASVPPMKKPSKFRRVPPRNVRSPQSSPLGPTQGHSRHASSSSTPTQRPNGADLSPKFHHAHELIPPVNDAASLPSFPASRHSMPPVLPAESLRTNVTTFPSHLPDAPPHDLTPLILNSRSVSDSSDAAAKTLQPTSSSTMPRHHPTAPYRPGFQPKGVYRPLTDDFISLRILKHGGEGDAKGRKKVERTKLERRLEKLIVLHFSSPSDEDKSKDPISARKRPPPGNRRASSFFDFDSLKNISINNSSGLWRGVVSGGLNDGGKQDIRGLFYFCLQ